MIHESWDQIPEVPTSEHEGRFLEALRRHGMGSIKLIVPLRGRYTKGRRWGGSELDAAIDAWHSHKSITFVSACLNRNPQDIIYKLLAYCKSKGIQFTQKSRTETIGNWTDKVKACAQDLFECGLPAWKIAVTFRVEFEHVEKELFVNRKQYGHDKKNPFGINTDHKQLVNRRVIEAGIVEIHNAFEPFAGEGRFTATLLSVPSLERIVCVESDTATHKVLANSVCDDRVELLCVDNMSLIGMRSLGKFDLIDLDPFVTCHEQLRNIWCHLNDKAYLFVTFGGEYRRSFIQTNRRSISARYGFFDEALSNKEYLELVPNFFLGFVAKMAASNGFQFEVLRAVRYANNCRFWLLATKSESANEWLNSHVSNDRGGYHFFPLIMPRFREVRAEIDTENAKKGR